MQKIRYEPSALNWDARQTVGLGQQPLIQGTPSRPTRFQPSSVDRDSRYTARRTRWIQQQQQQQPSQQQHQLAHMSAHAHTPSYGQQTNTGASQLKEFREQFAELDHMSFSSTENALAGKAKALFTPRAHQLALPRGSQPLQSTYSVQDTQGNAEIEPQVPPTPQFKGPIMALLATLHQRAVQKPALFRAMFPDQGTGDVINYAGFQEGVFLLGFELTLQQVRHSTV